MFYKLKIKKKQRFSIENLSAKIVNSSSSFK